MQQQQLQITSTRPFGKGFLNFNANTDAGPIEGIAWDESIQGHFVPGATIIVSVGQSKQDGAFWNDYRGKTRLEVNKNANIQPVGAAAPAAPQYQQPAPPAQQPTFPAPQAAPQPPQAPAPTPGAGNEEAVLQKACGLAARAATILEQQHGWSTDQARQAAGYLAECWPKYWFGEKGI